MQNQLFVKGSISYLIQLITFVLQIAPQLPSIKFNRRLKLAALKRGPDRQSSTFKY